MLDQQDFDVPMYGDLEQLADSFSDYQLKLIVSSLQQGNTLQMLREVVLGEWNYRNQEL